MMERRFVKGAKIRSSGQAAGEKPGIGGYAAVFNAEYVLWDSASFRVVEKINPGAFSRLFNHSADNVLGRSDNGTLRMVEDKEGLQFDNDLDLRSTIAQNVQAFIDRGDVSGCSFAFTVSKQTWREGKKEGKN